MIKHVLQAIPLVALLLGPLFAQPPGGLDDPELEQAVGLAAAARYEEALELFSRKLEKDPESSLFNYYVGLTHLYLKQRRQAVGFLEKSIEEEAAFPQAYYWCAQAHLASDDLKRAHEVIREGLEKFPANRKLLELMQEVAATVQKP